VHKLNKPSLFKGLQLVHFTDQTVASMH